jgi:hypothetical protein
MGKTIRNPGLLLTSEVDALLTIVEEATRATAGAKDRFIEPARGTLDRAKSRRHHIVFGRRGSGKTSLLRKARNDLCLDRRPVAFVDLESFKGHSYPDVLLSVLIEALNAFDEWLATAGVNSAGKKTWWTRFFHALPKRPPLNLSRVNDVRKRIKDQVAQLTSQLHAADGVDIQASERASLQSRISDHARLGITTDLVSATLEDRSSSSANVERQTSETAPRSKVDFLHRHIMDYQGIVDEIVGIAGGDSYLILDDLYHIRRQDQALVLDYFHRIAKGRGLWLKIGTIRHRSDWYRHGDPPTGMKLGDDCDEIDLDITLEKFSLAKDFLYKVLDQLVKESGLASYKELITRDGIDRLVLASGGVARDFLTIFRRSVGVARERLHRDGDVRGAAVGAEDVNNAAGEHDASKREELRRDTIDERDRLEASLAKIKEFCLAKKVNCLLVERDRESPGMQVIGELVDLRLLHLVASRVTLKGGGNNALYSGYMLDVSQYTGDRKRREFDMIPFWENPDRLRRVGIVFNPDQAFFHSETSVPV